MTKINHISIQPSYDKIDLDNQFLLINRCNLTDYLKRYNCHTEEELEDFLWVNHGVSIKII